MSRQSQATTRPGRLFPGFISYGEMIAFQTLRAVTGFSEYDAALERLEKE